MLKNRIIPIQLLLNGRLVKSKRFKGFRDVGDPIKSSSIYNSQFADELIFLNINKEKHGIDELLNVLKRVSTVCFMPLAVGGGVRTLDEAATLIKSGADKVIINTAAYQDKALIGKIADIFGRQAVIAAIDVMRENNTFQLYSHCGQIQESTSLETHIQVITQSGAGEILIQSIDSDGMMHGFDIDLFEYASSLTSLPIIACGGCGHYDHLKDLYVKTGIKAAACGSIFNFSDSNLLRAKSFLKNHNLPFKEI